MTLFTHPCFFKNNHLNFLITNFVTKLLDSYNMVELISVVYDDEENLAKS